jgi:hypothetical protein
MSNCRFFPNNSTTGGDVTLISCSNIAFNANTNKHFFPVISAGHGGGLSNGVTFGAIGQFSATAGYVVDCLAWSNNTTGAIKMIGKSRGATPGSHVAIQAGDQISEDRYIASNGSAFVPSAQVVVRAVATPTSSDNYIPSTYEIRTSPNASTIPSVRIFADEKGNAGIGGNNISATATTATEGFVYLQKTLGVPTGTPATIFNGKLPVIIDETNFRIYVYVGGTWKYAQLV